MNLLWLLCVGLVLGGLLACLARQVPWSTLRFRWTQLAPVPALAPRVLVWLQASGPGGRTLSPPGISTRAGPPGFLGAGYQRSEHFG